MVTFNFDASYPRYRINLELSILSEYIQQIDKSIELTCDNYVSNRKDENIPDDYIEFIKDEIPRVIRLPFVISIYSLYENSIQQLLKYAQKKEGAVLGLKDLNGRKLTSKFNKYMKHVLAYDFQFPNEFFETISNFTKVRNCIAHANGNIESLNDQKQKEIRTLEQKNIGVSTDIFQIDVTSDFLLNHFKLIAIQIVNLMEYMDKRYDIEP